MLAINAACATSEELVAMHYRVIILTSCCGCPTYRYGFEFKITQDIDTISKQTGHHVSNKCVDLATHGQATSPLVVHAVGDVQFEHHKF